MSDPTTFYCHGYVVTPIVEACEQRGLFQLLDMHEFRDRRSLIEELKANGDVFTIALEALESLGWVEANADHAYRLTSKAAGYRTLDLTPLYCVEPEQLIMQDAHALVLREAIEQVFFHSEAEEPVSPNPAHGAIIVPLIAFLGRVNEDKVWEDLNRVRPTLSEAVIKLFVRQKWLAADGGKLTPSGKALLQNSAFSPTVSYRPFLHAIGDVLFGDYKCVGSSRVDLQACKLEYSIVSPK